MEGAERSDPVDVLLAEQLEYYRARSPEYEGIGIPELDTRELEEAHRQSIAALDAFGPTGDVLELACGPGTWTPALLHYAETLTAVDGAPEMLARASEKVRDGRVRFVQANLFAWEPDRRYDVVFFGFWLSHVPLERFESFWAMVERCLKPDGRVAFIDDAFRTPDELIEGEDSSTIRRHVRDGTAFRAVKVPHTSEDLQRRLTDLGWDIVVMPLTQTFFWGAGGRAGRPLSPARDA